PAMSTIRRPGTRCGRGHSTGEMDPLERACPNRRPHRRAIPLAADTPPCAGSPIPACRRARTASSASRPDQTSRAKRVQRIVKDIVLVYLEVRKMQSLQVGDVDVCCHDFAALADLLS